MLVREEVRQIHGLAVLELVKSHSVLYCSTFCSKTKLQGDLATGTRGDVGETTTRLNSKQRLLTSRSIIYLARFNS